MEHHSYSDGVVHPGVYLKEQGRDLNLAYIVTNEANFGYFTPFMRKKTGAVIGVGSHQVLDLYANSNSAEAYILDHTAPVPMMMSGMLEAASLYEQVHGKHVTTDILAGLYCDAELLRTLLLNGSLTEDELRLTTLVAEKGFFAGVENGKPLVYSYGDYLRERAQLKDNNGKPYAWYATEDNVTKTVAGYRNGKVKSRVTDLRDATAMRALGTELEQSGVSVDTLYLSNMENHVYYDDEQNGFSCLWDALSLLPIDSNGTIFRTCSPGFGSPSTVTIVEHEELPPIIDVVSAAFHYNVEGFDHHTYMTELNPEYVKMGWIGALRTYKKAGLLPGKGYSFLSKQLSEQLTHISAQ